MSVNIRDARSLLGDLVKGAPSGHHLAQFEVSPIKQGALGWDAGRVWPVFEAMRPLAGTNSREDAVSMIRGLLTGGTSVSDVLDAFSAVDWPTVLPSMAAMSKAPASKPNVAPAPADPAGQPQGSTSAMKAVLQSLTASVEEAEQQEQAASAAVASQLEAMRRDVEALAKRMGSELATVEAAAKKAAAEAEGNVTAGALRGAVAETLKAMAPDEETVKAASKGARELPAVPPVDSLYERPDWHTDLALFIGADKHIVIGGSSGAGKTYPAKQICAELGRPCKVISANENLTADTLVSEPGIKGGTSFYTDGPLLHAMRHGYVLIIDEGDEIRRGEALVFNDALESRQLTNPYTGEVVTAQAGFVCVFTSNSLGDTLGIYNREGFDESLRQRLIQVIAHPLTLKQEVAILRRIEAPNGDKLTKEQATDLAKWAHAARPLHFGINGNEPVLESCPSTRVLVEAAEIWLGFNRQTGAKFRPFRDKLSDIREALWYKFASSRNDEEIAALRSVDLWIW